MNGNKEAGSLFEQFQEHNGESLGVIDDAVKCQNLKPSRNLVFFVNGMLSGFELIYSLRQILDINSKIVYSY